MSKKYQKALFIFRRDLRLEDNLGLLALLAEAETAVVAFIFDPKQIDRTQNPYFSEPAFQFLLNSLAELNESLLKFESKLHIFYGDPSEVVRSLISSDKIEAVFVNKDYTPFSRQRDKAIADVCTETRITFERHNDACLSPIEVIRTGEGKLYTVFTPFMRKASIYEVAKPQKNNLSNYFTGKLKTKTAKLGDFSADTAGMNLTLSGGRKEALRIMRKPKFLANYKNDRNQPSLKHSTSRLSAHHKFGTISIRETYQMTVSEVGSGSQFISELYWRDFYYYTAYHFPLVFKTSFLPWAKHLKWVNDEAQFQAWCSGQTGAPMVDAGMRQLNQTGWMHNRSRMIVASYLTKNLLIDWRWGERYFASKLIDYDPAQNNGGWQWSASVGVDPRPLRIFNPYTQATNYDKEALYIKEWVPELAQVPADLLTGGKIQDFSSLAPGYPAPIIDQKTSYRRAMTTYKEAKDEWRKQKLSDDNYV